MSLFGGLAYGSRGPAVAESLGKPTGSRCDNRGDLSAGLRVHSLREKRDCDESS